MFQILSLYLLIVVLLVALMFVIIKLLQYELFTATQHVVQEKQKKHEAGQHIQHIPLPAHSLPFDALPDTVYPRMPSSARRYSAPTSPAQHTTTASSPIPARASAHLAAVHEPEQVSLANHSSRESVVSLLPPKVQPLSSHDTTHYGDYVIEEFTEYESFLDTFDEDQAWNEEAFQEQPQLRLIVGIGSHPGIVRKNGLNEDNVLGIQDAFITEAGVVPTGLFVVADGMGGHSHGQEASRLAICAVSEVVTPIVLNANTEEVFCEGVLQSGVQRANSAIYQQSQQKFTMGTTVTAALVFGSTAYVANVGDSRTYLYRASEGLKQITTDHSYVWQLFKEGCIQYEDIYTHPRRNEIYRCLGEGAKVEIDTFQVTLQAHDVLLLCTD